MELRKFGMNTIMLYILTLSNYLFNFATIPYETRILGPEVYGIIGFASALMIYFRLVLDYGFILSATQRVAQNTNDRSILSRVLTDVLICKCMLGVLCAFGLAVICYVSPVLREHAPLYFLYLIGVIINSFLPDFLYRGLQQMKTITYRTIAVKGFFTVMVFVFLKNKSQYYVIPFLSMLGSVGAVLWSYWDVSRNLGIKLQNMSVHSALRELKRSTPFFVSRIASTVYGAMNTMVLKVLYPMGEMIGFYSSADKVVSLARSGAAPIADSLYPYMLKNKDFKMVKKAMKILMPLIIVAGGILWIFATPFCQFIFGEEYTETGKILRCLIPIMITVLPTYVMGFPVLSPLGLERYANLSNVVAACVQIAGLLILFALGYLNVYSVCLMTCVTEFTVLAFRCGAVLLYQRKQKSNMK